MNLPPEECDLFYRLQRTLLLYVAQGMKLLSRNATNPDDFVSLPLEKRLKVRRTLYAQLDLIDDFVDGNVAGLTEDELQIVAGWKHVVVGDFYVLRYLKEYAVFLAAESPPKAYGVLGLLDPLEKVIGAQLPVLTQAILLPFKSQITYDGSLNTYSVSFGPSIRKGLDRDYRRAKSSHGIITSLPVV